MRSGIANVFIMHVCIEYVFCCLFGTRRYPPTHTTGDNICLWNNQQFINSFASLNMYTSTNFHVRWGYLSKCSFSIGFFKAAHIVSEFYLNSLWVQQSYGNQSKCWNVQPSCSSHHVECTKTWMRDVSSVLWGDRTLFLKLDSQPTLVLPNIRNKNRATVADDRARCDTPKNLCIVLILPLAALRITYGKRISSDACLYTALKWNSCSQ